MDPKNNTSWGGVAGWYDDLLEKGEGTYQKEVVLPNLLRLIGPQKGERIIDIACGQGFFSRALSDSGAAVTGADISEELIVLARKNVPGADFHATPAHKLGFAKDGEFAKALIVLALQNIREADLALAEASRVLRSGGKLFIVLNHPAFRIPQASGWGFDQESGVQYRRVDRYLSEISVPIVMNPGEAAAGKEKARQTISFHRSLQFYFKELRKAGFSVSRLEEWISHKKSGPGPRQAAEDSARKEIPIFLFLEAEKR